MDGRRWLLSTCGWVVACLQVASAMPTKDEMDKAKPLVSELMSSVMESYMSAGRGQKTAAALRVATISSEFAESAETEAAKYLLLKSAVCYYARGGDYDKAADAVIFLQRAVEQVPPSIIAEITGDAVDGISETKATRLHALHRVAVMQVRACDEVKLLAMKLKKSPSGTLQRLYAEALAVSGDWKTARVEFAKVPDVKLRALLQGGTDGKAQNAELADFWWTYEPSMKDVREFFRFRAVTYYRTALEAGEFTGIKKHLVEKRIASSDPIIVFQEEENGLRTSVAVDESGRTPNGRDLVIELRGEKDQKIPMSFVLCPPGEFEMGRVDDESSPWYRHGVKISRKFWIGKYQVTWRQWNVFEKCWRFGGVKDKVFEALGGMDAVMADLSYKKAMAYCQFLTQKYKRYIPHGYVFRLPTEAEWEYACKANCTDESDLHVRFLARDKTVLPEIALAYGDCRRQMKAAGLSDEEMPKNYATPPGRPGQKKPNAWGIYDLAGNGCELMLDLYHFDDLPQRGRWGRNEWDQISGRLRYERGETDPLPYVDVLDHDTFSLVRSRPYWWDDKKVVSRVVRGNWVLSTIRLVIGPDLVGEWKARHEKKKITEDP